MYKSKWKFAGLGLLALLALVCAGAGSIYSSTGIYQNYNIQQEVIREWKTRNLKCNDSLNDLKKNCLLSRIDKGLYIEESFKSLTLPSQNSRRELVYEIDEEINKMWKETGLED